MGLTCTPALCPELDVMYLGRSNEGGCTIAPWWDGRSVVYMCGMSNFCLLCAVESGPGHLARALGGGDGVFQNCC